MQQKKRPALVVATLTGDDVILCQITSQAVTDRYAVPLIDADFTTGGLQQASNVRPNRLFTAEGSIILQMEIAALLAWCEKTAATIMEHGLRE